MRHHHDHTLIRDIDVFDHTYLPEYFNHRDAQLQELAYLIDPALRGALRETPSSEAPRGPGRPQRSGGSLPRSKRPPSPGPPASSSPSTSTAGRATLIAVYRCIAQRLLGYPSPSRYLEDIRDGIAAHLSERNATLLICLDDANYLIAAGIYNPLLYHLFRLYERWGDVRGAGVFAVTSDLRQDLCAEADGAVQSVFRPTEISFLPYTTAEIREILGYRVHQGLYPGVMPAGVLDLAAQLTADARDIRMGIDLVRTAATRAGKEGRSRVTRRDVLDVVAGVKSPVLAARAAALSSGERSLLYQLAEQSLAGDTMMAGAIFEEAQEYIAVGKTTYHTRLRRLADAGIIDLLWTRKGHEVFLRYSPDEVFAACARAGGLTSSKIP